MKVTQLCPTLCDPMDCNLSGSSVHEILQARILEWVDSPFSRASSQPKWSNPGLPHCRQILYIASEPSGKLNVQDIHQIKVFRIFMNLTLVLFVLEHIPYIIFANGKGSGYRGERLFPFISTSFSIGKDGIGNVFE